MFRDENQTAGIGGLRTDPTCGRWKNNDKNDEPKKTSRAVLHTM